MSRLSVGIVTNLYPTKRHFEEGTFVKDLSQELVKSGCAVKVIHYRRNFAGMFLETLALRKRFDILDAQFIVPSGLATSLTPKFCPFVTTVHRWDILDFPYRWPTAAQWTRFVLHRADGIVAVSKYIAREVAKFSSELEKIRVIPNAVDTSKFRPSDEPIELRSRLGIPENSFLIFSTGRLVPIKGYEYLLFAPREAVKSHCDVTLVIAGDGSRRPYLESLSESLGVRDRVRFLGRIHHDDPKLLEFYQACDVFALTSLVEGHSVAITEAMACGKPIICSRNPGNEEVVIDNFNGLLVPLKDSRRIASAIQVLCNSTDLLESFGENSRRLACERFSWSTRIGVLLEFYEYLLRSSENN